MQKRIFKLVIVILAGILFITNVSPLPLRAQSKVDSKKRLTLRINPEYIDVEFDGIGAVSAGASSRLLIDYPEPIRSKLLDYLFKPQYGASFDHLKVEIGGDVNSTDGTEPSHMRKPDVEDYTKGYEWWLMQEAKKRNPDIKLGALAWGAPGWVGDGDFYTKEGAKYIASFVEGAKKEYGLKLNYVGILNEHDLRVPYIKILRKALDKRGLEDIKIVANDPHASMKYWKIADSMRVDPELNKAVDVIGVHYPRKETNENALQLQEDGKKIWSSEDQYANGVNINMNFIERHLTKTEFWSPITSYYDALTAPNSGLIKANTPWSGYFQILPRLWALAHTTQFTEPGWFYIENGNKNLSVGGSIVSLTSPDHKELSLIVETRKASEEQELRVEVPSKFNGRTLHVWHSNRLAQFLKQKDLKIQNGSFSITLSPTSNYSITTTSGQTKGAFTSPSPSPFPLPYSEDFENYKQNETPRYLSDMYGAFEVEVGKNGEHYLTQKITQKGIMWLDRIPDSKAKSAFTVIGDERWNDIRVSVDAKIGKPSKEHGTEKDRYVSVITRYNPKNFDNFKQPYPVGYTFRLFADGRWNITTGHKVIDSGMSEEPGSKWHQITMKNQGELITALIDGKQIVKINDPTYRRGLAGIGSSLNTVQFDNINIRDVNK